MNLNITLKNIFYLNFLRNLLPKYIYNLFLLTYNNIWNLSYQELGIICNHTFIYNIIFFFKYNTFCYFNSLIDIACVDYPFKTKRFELNYLLLSYFYNTRLRIKIQFKQNDWINSLISLFKSANWLERECWDMMGIFFKNHTDLRRILTDYGFQNFPLRKDFPVFGYIEIKYNSYLNKLIFSSVEFNQEYRTFEFKSPWENTK